MKINKKDISAILYMLAGAWFGFSLSAFYHAIVLSWQFWATFLPVTVLALTAGLFQTIHYIEKSYNSIEQILEEHKII